MVKWMSRLHSFLKNRWKPANTIDNYDSVFDLFIKDIDFLDREKYQDYHQIYHKKNKIRAVCFREYFFSITNLIFSNKKLEKRLIFSRRGKGENNNPQIKLQIFRVMKDHHWKTKKERSNVNSHWNYDLWGVSHLNRIKLM